MLSTAFSGAQLLMVRSTFLWKWLFCVLIFAFKLIFPFIYNEISSTSFWLWILLHISIGPFFDRIVCQINVLTRSSGVSGNRWWCRDINNIYIQSRTLPSTNSQVKWKFARCSRRESSFYGAVYVFRVFFFIIFFSFIQSLYFFDSLFFNIFVWWVSVFFILILYLLRFITSIACFVSLFSIRFCCAFEREWMHETSVCFFPHSAFAYMTFFYSAVYRLQRHFHIYI